MNDAMPQWRTFSSEPPAPTGATMPVSPGTPAPWSRLRLDAVTASLIGLGAAGLAGALVIAILLMGTTAPDSGILADTGEPLGDLASLVGGVPLSDGAAAGSVPANELVVDVAGAVERPGLHRLAPGARVGDAIEAAGGFAARVDLAQVGHLLNLAEPLSDGTKVHVPEMGYDLLVPASVDDGRIDLNGADQALLETLPGIGPVTAAKIIDARSGRRFEAVRDLRERGLVGESVFQQIMELVRVG